MSELLLVNPRRKRTTRRRRARRRMTALQRQYFGKRRSTHRKRRRRTATLLATNPAPVKHRRRRASSKRRSFRRSFAARRARLSGFNVGSFTRDTLFPSAVGAIGALGVDVALGYANPFLPSFMTSGIGVPLTKIAGAVGIGMAAGMLTNRRIGEQVMAGAITVVMYNWLRTHVQASLPNLTLAGMGYAGPALAYPDNLGMYVNSGAAVPPQVVAAIAAANAGKTAPAAGMGEYVSGYTEGGYQYH